MNTFDDYALHILQKHRLAVALAVIKSKPEDVSLEDHIQQLRCKYNNNSQDIEYDLSFNSDDFKFDDNEYLEDIELTNKSHINHNKLQNITYNDHVQQEVIDTNTQCMDTQDLNESITILQTLNEGTDEMHVDNPIRKSASNALNILKQCEDGTINAAKERTKYSPSKPGTSKQQQEDLTQCNPVIDLTQNSDENDANGNFHLNTDVKKSSVNYRKTKVFKNIYHNVASIFDNKNNETDANLRISSNQNEGNLYLATNSQTEKTVIGQSLQNCKVNNATQNFTCNTHYSQSQLNDEIEIENRYIHGRKNCIKQNTPNSEEVVSKKRKNEILIIKDEIIHRGLESEITVKVKKRPEDKQSTHNDTVQNYSQDILFSQELSQGLTSTHLVEGDVEGNKNRVFDSNKEFQNKNIAFSVGSYQNCMSGSLPFPKVSDNLETNNYGDFHTNSRIVAKTEYLNNTSNNQDLHIHNTANVCEDTPRNIETNNKHTDFNDEVQVNTATERNDACQDFTNIDDNLQEADEQSGPDIETVPFKIIKELDKVKFYLNKKAENSQKEFSSDTGYRTDSYNKISLSSSQTPISSVDQSAHSLFKYITECPLITSTHDITREISVILGQLIDRLHEEEKYPAFLEDMLEYIQKALAFINKDNNQDCMVFENEEYVHRVILLNKSVHVQKYTIQKLTQKLVNLHKDLTTNDTEFEFNNINQLESVCYLFHLLEMLLVKYKRSLNVSQGTENTHDTQNLSQPLNSQESLKKSGIMDIWRKKWLANDTKQVQHDDDKEKSSEISKCCEILNKIIVECMEGYSLISYYALKCFNVMQK